MAHPNNYRPLNNAKSQPSPSNMTTAGALNSSFGSSNTAWGANNWNNGSLSNGFNSRAATRDNSASRAGAQKNVAGDLDDFEGKTGSSSLLDSSVSDAWSCRSSWGAKRSLPSGQLSSQAKYNETSTQQQRSVSDAIAPNSRLSAVSQNPGPTLSRPPTINLSSTAPTSGRLGYGSAFPNSFSDRKPEPAPKVFTKLDRPVDPNSRNLPDSAKGSLWLEPSPTEERHDQFSLSNGGRSSLNSSRHGSQPPSRDGEDRSFFPRHDYGRPAQRQTHNNSRTPSLSFHGNSAHVPLRFPYADELATSFNQLNFSANSASSSNDSQETIRPVNNLNSAFPPNPTLPRNLNRFGSHVESADDAQAGGSYNIDYAGLHDFGSTLPTAGSYEFSSPTSNSRFSQTSVAGGARHSQAYSNGPSAVTGYDAVPGARQDFEWPPSGTASATPRHPSALQQHPTFFDPRTQQFAATQFGNAYNAIYNPYALPTPLGVNGTTPLLSFMPINVHNLAPAPGTLEIPDVDKVQSTLMFEFKASSKSRKYELKEIYDHIAEFSGDQHGSRFIQTALETANSDEKERVFREISPNAIPLMTDVFGNYVIQKFFEHGDQTHKKILANKMKGQVLNLSLQMYGCRVVQKALDHVLIDQQAQLVGELEGHVLRCVKDQNGNHVIQKAIERCPPSTIGFIIAAFQGQVQHLSIHPYGCRVVQRCLERCEPHSKAMIMRELMDGIQTMISDIYGNYVVQHVVAHDDGEAKRLVLSIVGRALESYSKHKFASNVVEKCLEKADDHWRRDVVCILVNGDQRRCEGEGVLVGMIKDNFGNYVIQKLLDTLCADDYFHFLDLLQPAMNLAKRTGCGKQVVSIEKKMHKFASYRGGTYQLPLPTPPYASNFNSAAPTPPQLAADLQTPQSSAVPSINGDAVEGAALGSWKESELSNDRHYAR